MAKRKVSSLYLKSAYIEGFRSIKELDIDFEKGLNILIGKNGVGKSNLLKILDLALPHSGLRPNTPVRRLSLSMKSVDSNDSFEVDYVRKTVDPQELEVHPSQKHYFERSLTLNNEKIDIKQPLRKKPRTGESIQIYLPRNFLHSFILKAHNLRFPRRFLLEYNIPRAIEYTEVPGKIVLDCDLQDVHFDYTFDFLHRIFWKLETELTALFDEESEPEVSLEYISEKLTPELIKSHLVFDEHLIDSLSKYTPIKQIRFNPNINIYRNNQEFIIDNVKIDFYVNENWIPWSQLSDGTKRLFYIISQIQDLDNDIVLLEEPELGIHPHQFFLLMQFLIEKSDTNQIIVSTHSPLALNHIDKDELDRIQIVSYEKEVGTKARKLSKEEKQKAKIYMDELGYLSDYWVHSDLEQ